MPLYPDPYNGVPAGQQAGHWGPVKAQPLSTYGGQPGLGALGGDLPASGQVCQSGGTFAATRIVGALAGYYVGKKLGPSGSHAGAVGAAAAFFAGPVGLAIVAAYYAKKGG